MCQSWTPRFQPWVDSTFLFPFVLGVDFASVESILCVVTSNLSYVLLPPPYYLPKRKIKKKKKTEEESQLGECCHLLSVHFRATDQRRPGLLPLSLLVPQFEPISWWLNQGHSIVALRALKFRPIGKKEKKKGGIEAPGSIAKTSFHEGSCKYTPSLERENRRRGMHAWNPAMIDQWDRYKYSCEDEIACVREREHAFFVCGRRNWLLRGFREKRVLWMAEVDEGKAKITQFFFL